MKNVWKRIILVLLMAGSLTLADEFAKVTQEPAREISASLFGSLPYEKGPVIPGLHQHAVPQGLAYSKEHDALFISQYFDKKRPSCISVIDYTSGKLIHSRVLKESSDAFHYGHVGGIAVSETSLWVASGGRIYEYSLTNLINPHDTSALIPWSTHAITDPKTAFCTYYENTLFVGEFGHGKKYTTHPSHHMKDRNGTQKYAWVCGYAATNDFKTPTSILSIPQKVQGMYITGDYIFLSMSYGRRNRSVVSTYRNPLKTLPHSMVKLKQVDTVPLWFLDGRNLVKSTYFPPMLEGITGIEDKMAVLTESGAAKYQKNGKGSVDYLILIDMDELLP